MYKGVVFSTNVCNQVDFVNIRYWKVKIVGLESDCDGLNRNKDVTARKEHL